MDFSVSFLICNKRAVNNESTHIGIKTRILLFVTNMLLKNYCVPSPLFGEYVLLLKLCGTSIYVTVMND